ncbi:hypothetical protein DLI07_25140 [Vibrio parahaemolyticus]|nr:hypothetical protein [Vibrio parahaemolyticus]EGR2760393.1 hypothetical protein [Vibrio parahaemolyticus]EGR2876980.1 hypothetical protein [Vibrio parahaemolyticus]EGR2950576.1 hypothetical protein [Vibrio parahaemolyticus]EGR2970145.1 hypothetical protein [Vibrio parahaemolyticus]
MLSRNSLILELNLDSLLLLPCQFSSKAHNALLRGEQRNTEAAAYRLNHLNQRIVKMPRVANPS